jgi:hypothetical protein
MPIAGPAASPSACGNGSRRIAVLFPPCLEKGAGPLPNAWSRARPPATCSACPAAAAPGRREGRIRTAERAAACGRRQGASLPRSACTGEIRPRDRRNCGRVESNHPDFRGLSRDAAAIEDGAGSEDDGKPIAMRRKQSTTSWLRIGQAPAQRTVRALDLPGRARLTSFRSGAGSPRTMIPAMPGESHERGRFIGHARLQW